MSRFLFFKRIRFLFCYKGNLIFFLTKFLQMISRYYSTFKGMGWFLLAFATCNFKPLLPTLHIHFFENLLQLTLSLIRISRENNFIRIRKRERDSNYGKETKRV